MERTMWADERLNDRFDRLDRTLDRVDRDIRDVRTEIRDLRQLVFQLWGTTVLGILATIATVIVTN